MADTTPTRRSFLTTVTGTALAATGTALLPAAEALARPGARVAATLDVVSDVQGDLADFARVLDRLDAMGTADALVVNGDLVATGRASEYEAYYDVLDAHPHPEPVLSTFGNHEQYTSEPFDTQRARFLDHTGMPDVYSRTDVGGVPLLTVGTTRPQRSGGDGSLFVTLGQEQLSWLDSQLSERRRAGGGPVLVFSHHVLSESVSGSVGEDRAAFYDQDFVDEAELLEVLGGHPDAVFFSGHTHWSLERDDWAARKVVAGGHPDGFTCVNTGFVQTMYGPDGRGGEQALDGAAAQGLRVEVAEDGGVTVHAHDHRNGRPITSLVIPPARGAR
jgi:3',5'-cyclic AMP phosphodiesterase CpdA